MGTSNSSWSGLRVSSTDTFIVKILLFSDSKYTKKKGNNAHFLNIFFDKTTNSSNFACCNSNRKSNGKKNKCFPTVS